jgi:hypothetical protein
MVNIVHDTKYISLIIIYGILFFLLGVTLAKYNEKLFPPFDKSILQKSKARVLLEATLQVLTSILITYFIRIIARVIFDNLLQFTDKLGRSPDKFAVIIVAPTMFAAQPNLLNKIRYIWSISSAEHTYYINDQIS